MDKQLAEYRQVSGQPLRVYRDSSDQTGRIMCRAHRDSYYLLYPSARGNGEWGGDCEPCLAGKPGFAITSLITSLVTVNARPAG